MTDTTAPSAWAPFARFRARAGAHPGLVDGVLAFGLWLFFGLMSVATGAGNGQIVVLLVMTALQIWPLAWRRTRPDLSFGLITAGHVLQLAGTDMPLPTNVSALLSAYAVAAYSERTAVRRIALAVAAVAGPLATLDWDNYGINFPEMVFNSLMLSGLALVCWLGGDLTRKRREVLDRLREHNDALRRDRDQRARLAAQNERTRIAREMHDIVAHSLSVVVVQADGAAYAAAHSPEFDREIAQRALTTIGTTAREALAETRRLVGVLRTEDEGRHPAGLAYAPTESLADLPDLMSRVAAAGMVVALDLAVDPQIVPRETGLAAYRIVQESLTNVIKHAGPDVAVRVRVGADTDDRLHVEVRDDGRGAAAPDDGHGHGIIGLRERAASVGGTITAGPVAGGGYVVTADLPFEQEESR